MCVICYNGLNNTPYSTKLDHYFVHATYKTLQLYSPTSQNPTEIKKINNVHFLCNYTYIIVIITNSQLVARFYLPITAPAVFGLSCCQSFLFDTVLFTVYYSYSQVPGLVSLQERLTRMFRHRKITYVRKYVCMYVCIFFNVVYCMFHCMGNTTCLLQSITKCLHISYI
jgi:hypothetical protein